MPSGLFYYAVLATEDDTHATQVANLGPADDQRVNVETSASEDARYARKDSGFILDETVQDMSRSKVMNMSTAWKCTRDTYFLKGWRLGGGVL